MVLRSELGQGSWSWKVRQWRRHFKARMSQPGEALGRDGWSPFRLQWRPMEKKRDVNQFHTRREQDGQARADFWKSASRGKIQLPILQHEQKGNVCKGGVLSFNLKLWRRLSQEAVGLNRDWGQGVGQHVRREGCSRNRAQHSQRPGDLKHDENRCYPCKYHMWVRELLVIRLELCSGALLYLDDASTLLLKSWQSHLIKATLVLWFMQCEVGLGWAPKTLPPFIFPISSRCSKEVYWANKVWTSLSLSCCQTLKSSIVIGYVRFQSLGHQPPAAFPCFRLSASAFSGKALVHLSQ